MDYAYSNWARKAEEELCEATGHRLKKWGTRSRAPKLVWRRIFPDHPAVHSKHIDTALYFLQWIVMQLRLLKFSYEHQYIKLRTHQIRILASTPRSITDYGEDEKVIKDIIAVILDRPQCVMMREGTDIQMELEAKVRKGEAAARAKARKGWADTLHHSMSNGGGLVHRLAKPKISWAPTSALDDDEIALGDPVTLLNAEAKKFSDLWDTAQERNQVPKRKSSPKVCLQ